MQYGPRVVWGTGCPSTLSGAHVIEFNETGSEATCSQCALVLEGADLLSVTLALPFQAQFEMMEERMRQEATLAAKTAKSPANND